MRTILYIGSSTDLGYERDLLKEWDKTSVHLASCLALPQEAALAKTGTDAVVSVPGPEGSVCEATPADPLCGVDAVVLESGELDADELRAHPQLAVVVVLDERQATVDVAEATAQNIWVTHAHNRALLGKLRLAPSSPTRADRRHALQDALAGIAGERPSGRVNEL